MKRDSKFFYNNGEILYTRNGFTLIELLAIIVILAIIAVITVPIILDVIENSRTGTIVDSAYGYKDAVQKYYLEKVLDDSNYNALNGIYNVEDGVLKKGVAEHEINVSGNVPSEGWVQIDNGRIVDYSLRINGYAANYDETTNSVTVVALGELKNAPEIIETCPGCVFGTVGASIGSPLPGGYSESYSSLGNSFLGHIVSNDIVLRSFACGKKGNDYVCVEGGINEEELAYKPVYNANINTLNDYFQNCEDDSSYYQCYDVPSTSLAYNYGTVYIKTDNDSIAMVDYQGNSIYVSQN